MSAIGSGKPDDTLRHAQAVVATIALALVFPWLFEDVGRTLYASRTVIDLAREAQPAGMAPFSLTHAEAGRAIARRAAMHSVPCKA